MKRRPCASPRARNRCVTAQKGHAEDPSIQKSLDEARDLAQKLGLQGTPLFLVGDREIAGAPDGLYEQLTKDVAEIREKGCKAKC